MQPNPKGVIPSQYIYTISVPISSSLWQGLRQQLHKVLQQSPWEVDRSKDSLPGHLESHPPTTYVSALPQQLLGYLSPALPDVQALGNELLAQLSLSTSQAEGQPWRGWVNGAGYLYFQPTPIAITNWVKFLQALPATHADSRQLTSPSLQPAQSIILQYIYARCHQLQGLRTVGSKISEQVVNQMLDGQSTNLQLLHALMDIWDASISDRQVLIASQRLAEEFLNFERECQLGRAQDENLVCTKLVLIDITHKTIGIILRKHWGFQPQQSW